jgi:predicted unusual protein kinase regulating ubiquinone biosynthesis (AarF/ABC1/UbiB family)
MTMIARCHRRDGEWLQALHVATAALTPGRTPHPLTALEIGLALLRVARPADALPYLDAAADLGRAEAARCRRLLGEADDQIADPWHREVRACQGTPNRPGDGNPRPLLRRLSRGSAMRTHDRLLLATFWAMATLPDTELDQLPSIRGLKEMLPPPDDPLRGDDLRGWHAAISALATLKDALTSRLDATAVPSTVDEGLALCGAAAALAGAPDVEIEALGLAATARLARRLGHEAVAATLRDRYRDLSRALSGGRLDDLYGTSPLEAEGTAGPATLEQSYFTPAAQVRRVAQLATGVAGAAVTGWFHQLFADPRHAEALRDEQMQKYVVQLREFFSHAKGLMLKASQFIDFIESAFPAPVAEELKIVRRRNGAALEPDLARRIVEADLGQPIDRLFAAWDNLPTATASIGQVHRARRLDGREVAVKVKFPSLERLIRGQMRSIGVVAPLLEMIYPGLHIRKALKAAARVLLNECDFRLEAANQTAFRAAVAGIEGVVVPAVHDDLSGANVLTMDFVHGTRFWEFVAGTTQAERDVAGERIFRALTHASHNGGIRHGDPHPGNFMFQNDAVVILDFGACSRQVEARNRQFEDTVHAVRDDDPTAVIAALSRYGFLRGVVTGAARDEIVRLMGIDFAPYAKDAPFRFTPTYLQEIYRGLNRSIHHFQIPSEDVEHLRYFVGMASTLAALSAEANWARLLDELLTPHARTDDYEAG